MLNITRNRCAHATLALAAIAFAAGAANAVVLPFSNPNFDWLANGVNASANHIWTTNDHWGQAFNGTGLASATKLTLDLNISLDATPFENLSLDVFVNGNTVGSFTLTPADSGFKQYMFNFGAIPGDNYSIYMVATNTISDGAGSYNLILTDATGATSRATLTPTPGALALLTPGALVITRRRRAN